jgi:hypothetical protein
VKKSRSPWVEIRQWTAVTMLLVSLAASGIYTNITLRSVGKNLPNTLLNQLNDQALVLELLGDVLFATELTRAAPRPENFIRLRHKVEEAYQAVVELRDTYVFDNLIQASAFHAVVAPAVADVRLWLTEGVSGYAPETMVVVEISLARISEAFQKGRELNHESHRTAQNILAAQRDRLDLFLHSANLLFLLTLLVIVAMFLLLVRQARLQRR